MDHLLTLTAGRAERHQPAGPSRDVSSPGLDRGDDRRFQDALQRARDQRADTDRQRAARADQYARDDRARSGHAQIEGARTEDTRTEASRDEARASADRGDAALEELAEALDGALEGLTPGEGQGVHLPAWQVLLLGAGQGDVADVDWLLDGVLAEDASTATDEKDVLLADALRALTGVDVEVEDVERITALLAGSGVSEEQLVRLAVRDTGARGGVPGEAADELLDEQLLATIRATVAAATGTTGDQNDQDGQDDQAEADDNGGAGLSTAQLPADAETRAAEARAADTSRVSTRGAEAGRATTAEQSQQAGTQRSAGDDVPVAEEVRGAARAARADARVVADPVLSGANRGGSPVAAEARVSGAEGLAQAMPADAARSDASTRASSLPAGVQRVLEVVQQLEKQPPPRQLVLELGDLRMRIGLDEQGQVRLTLLQGDGSDGDALLGEARDALADHGFDLAGGDAEASADDHEGGSPTGAGPTDASGQRTGDRATDDRSRRDEEEVLRL